MPRAELNDRGDLIAVTTRWTEKELIQAVPGSRWDPGERVWTVPLSWAACLQLRGTFGADLDVGPRLAVWSQDEVRDRVGPASKLRDVITRVDGDWHADLYDFQTAGAAFLLAAGEGAVLGDDLGLGKTAQVLAALDALTRLSTDDALPALVICPNGVKLDWVRQVERWGVDSLHPYPVVGGAAGRRKILAAARGDPRALVIMNVESVRLLSRLAPYGSVRLARCRECDPRRGEERLTTSRCEVHHKELNDFGFRTVILDECHRIKDPASKQTRACWAVGHDPSVRRRWAMTGTLISNNVADLWSVWHFICPREAPVKSKFVDMYGLQAWNAFGGLDVVGINPLKRDEFHRILAPRFRRTPKALVRTQVPPVVRPVRWTEMSPRQERAYRDVERTLTAQVNDEIMVAKNNLVAATRKFQLASSYLDVEWVEQAPTEKHSCECFNLGRTQHLELCPDRMRCVVHLAEPSPKLDALMEDVEALGDKQVVIAAQSRQLIDLTARRLMKAKIPHGLMTGAVDEFDRNVAKKRFMDRELRVLLLTLDVGGTGVDGLQVADTMLVLQRSWKMIANVQLDGRVDRFGSEAHDSVTIVDYVTRGTTEETKLFPRLSEKWRQLEEINRDRERLAAAGLTSPSDTFDLDQREALILASDLGGVDIGEED